MLVATQERKQGGIPSHHTAAQASRESVTDRKCFTLMLLKMACSPSPGVPQTFVRFSRRGAENLLAGGALGVPSQLIQPGYVWSLVHAQQLEIFSSVNTMLVCSGLDMITFLTSAVCLLNRSW